MESSFVQRRRDDAQLKFILRCLTCGRTYPNIPNLAARPVECKRCLGTRFGFVTGLEGRTEKTKSAGWSERHKHRHVVRE